MARTATIQSRIEPQTKIQAQNILNKLNISLSEAISMYLKQIILHNGIPFDLKIPNQATLQAVEELESGKGVTFNNTDDLLKDLES
jgi:DNA-damage-inducible protein J